MNRTNVVLTGLPRSGTTLAVHLLNRLPDTVALHEPLSPGRFADLEGREEMLDGVERFFRRMRRMIRTQGVAVSKNVGGRITDNAYKRERSEGGLRPHAAAKGTEKGKVAIDKSLERDFLLVVKQPAMFSALLPILVERFPSYAIVRNPLSVLSSWNSVDHNVRNGRSPGAEKYDEDLSRALRSIEDRTGRQLHLLSWWYERFLRVLPDECVIRYEEIVASGGGALSVMTPAAKALDEPLEERNLNAAYDRVEMRELGERLMESEGAYWHLYSRASVEELLSRVA